MLDKPKLTAAAKQEKLQQKYKGSEARRTAAKVQKHGSESEWKRHQQAKLEIARKAEMKARRPPEQRERKLQQAEKLLRKYGGSEEKRAAAKAEKHGSEEAWKRHEFLKRNPMETEPLDIV